MPEPVQVSPLDVPGVTIRTPITRDDILASITESRQRAGDDELRR